MQIESTEENVQGTVDQQEEKKKPRDSVEEQTGCSHIQHFMERETRMANNCELMSSLIPNQINVN